VITEAIKNLLPNAKFHIYGNFTYDDIEWRDSRAKPSKADVDAEIIRINVAYDSQAYARDRITAYPSTGDQLDYIYHNGVAKWKTDMIDPVKTKYPKG
jgi:hypothetical protein